MPTRWQWNRVQHASELFFCYRGTQVRSSRMFRNSKHFTSPTSMTTSMIGPTCARLLRSSAISAVAPGTVSLAAAAAAAVAAESERMLPGARHSAGQL
eukprot:895491-Prorocentrum_minimum.AAC.1